MHQMIILYILHWSKYIRKYQSAEYKSQVLQFNHMIIYVTKLYDTVLST